MRLHKISRSVRMPEDLRRRLHKSIVRLSLNPVLYLRSLNLIHWHRRAGGLIPAAEVIRLALQRYPALSLSAAAETVTVDLLMEHAASQERLTPEEQILWKRFFLLSPLEKIGVTQKRIRTLLRLKSLVTQDEGRKRI